MPRRGKVKKRKILPDSVYGSVLVQKFINKIMIKGKKSVAEGIFYKSCEAIKEKMKKDPLLVFETAIKNVTPLMEVKPRRVGGSTYQVPVEVSPERGVTRAMQWIRDNARGRRGQSMVLNLSAEIIDAFNGTGAAIKKREDTHKMAEANRAFAHFRW